MSGPYGPTPYAPTPEQPTFNSWCVAWDAFDVPRIWDIVATEDNPRGWEQINGFSRLAELLVDHHRRLERQHFILAQAWQSSAASEMLQRIAALAEALLSDANCAQSTAHALHNIMTTYAAARVEIGRIHTRWNNVTTDWIPEWWDSAAGELNAQAQSVMIKTDEAVRDFRTRILAPRVYEPFIDIGVPIEDVPLDGGMEMPGRPGTVPPVPGYWPFGSNAELASSSRGVSYIPAVPGQPVSMLPVPPGNTHVPPGGAYILPGPGVGQTGFLIAMPRAPKEGDPRQHNGGIRSLESTSQPDPRLRLNRQTGTSHSGGVVGGAAAPVAIGTPMSGNNGGNSGGVLYRRPNVAWTTRHGVSPIIEGIGDEPDQFGSHRRNDEESFRRWFSELAYPWRPIDRQHTEPLVIIRRTVE